MPYIGQRPATGEANSFKILDEISSFTMTFDGSDAAVVSVANDTITEREHRFVTGQRVTYNDGGGTAITGLSDGVYYIIVEDRHTFKLASSANNAAGGTAINLTGLGVGASHTLNVAFDGVNTKFKATVDNGDRAGITRSGQLMLSINGVLQEPHDNTDSPTTGYATDHTSTIIFSAAPAATDQFFGRLIASNFPTFDISDNTVDNFTGDGSTTSFTLSKTPANNENVLVTIDGVVQYPDDTSAIRAYNVSENVLTFASAPGSAVEIQVRHIGFAGATSGGSGGVTGFYGRTGNAALKSTDNIVFNNATASGTVQAANVTVTGDLTVNGTTTTLDTDLIGVDKLEVAANNTTVAAAITQTGTGDILNLYDGSTEVFSIADGGKVTGVGSITAASFHGDGSQLTGIDATQIQTGNTSVQTVDTGSDGHVKINTEGSEKLRVTSAGNVGIGTNDPGNHKLHLYGATNSDLRLTATGDDIINIFTNANRSSANDTIFAIKGEWNGTQVANIKINAGDDTTNKDDGYITFNTRESGAGSSTERLRIDSAGKLGIGIPSPAYLAHIHNAGTGTGDHAYLHFTTGDTGSTGSDGLTVGVGANETAFINYRESGPLVLATSGTEKLRITSGGNIGVAGATGTDYSLLDGMVINTANGSAGLLINSSSSSHNAYLGFSYGSGSSTSHADQYSAYIGRVGDNTLILGTDNNIRVRIDANGHMGLGVTPSAWATNGDFTGLQVKGASLFGRGSGDEDRGGIAVNYYHTGSAEKYIANGNAARIYLADGNIHFSNAPANSSGAGAAMTLTERMRITSDGYALLTTANARLEWTASSGSNPFIRSIGSGQQELEFNTGGAERIRIAANGQVTVGNTIFGYAGTSSPYNNNSGTLWGTANISITGRWSTVNWPSDYSNPDTSQPWYMMGRPNGTDDRWTLAMRPGSSNSLYSIIDCYNDSNGQISSLSFHTGGGSERLKLDAGGRVSLHGLTASSYYSTYNSFVLGKTNDSAGMTIVSKNDSSGYIVFADGTSGDERYAGRFSYDHNVNSFKFDTNGGTNRLTIDSNGSVLVNTAGQSTQYSYSMKMGQGTYANNDSTPPHYGLWVRQNGPRYALNYGIFSEVVGDIGYYGGSTLDGLTSVRGIGVYGVAKSSAQAYQKGIGVYGKATNTTSNYNTSIGVRGRAEIGTTTFSNNNGKKSYGGHFVSTGKADCVGVYADAYLDGSPGAGQEAIPLLVSSNGTEKLRVDATQNALILSHNNALTLKYNNSTQKDLSYAATRYIYVSDSGDDSTGDGSSSSPWRTMSKALASVPKFLIWNCYVIMKGSSFTDGTGSNTLEGIYGWGKVLITSESGTVTYNKTKQFVVYDCHARIEFQNIAFVCPVGGTGFALERNHFIEFKSGCSYEFQGQSGWSWQAGVYALHNDRIIVACNTTCTNNSTSGLGGVWLFDNCKSVSFSGDLTKNGTRFNNHGIACTNGTWIYLTGDITNFARGLALGANHYGNETRADAVVQSSTFSNCGDGIKLYHGSLLRNYSSSFSNNTNTNIDASGGVLY